ncbi:MAG: glycosyltransferase family 4 protein [Pseudomonadota bacterium]
MKILFAIKNISSAKGGAERVLVQVSSGLAERGHNVSLVSFDEANAQSYYPLHGDIQHIGLGIGNANEEARFFETVQRMHALRKTLKTQQPDIVIGFMHSMFVPLSFAALGLGIPVIASEHIVPAHYKTRPFQFLMLIISALLVKRMTAVSEAVRASYPKIVQSKMDVLPNPVTMPESIKRNGTGRKTILNVGRLDEQKDQETLINAFAEIANNHTEWDLKIFGDGHLRESLQALIKKHDLKGRAFLMGTTQDIDAEYSAADIFAMSSRYESFGLATAEAMAHGVPAIGFAECPGTNEIIIDGVNGLLISKANKNAADVFAEALEKLIQDDALREKLGQAAPASIAHYSLSDVVDQWESLIQKSLDRSKNI